MVYNTLTPSTATFVEKRSKFIANVSSVKTQQEANSFIMQLKTQYYDARHNIYAYILKDGTSRYSDDGEPQGTAGIPVLEILKRRELINVVAVVTRYFGGVQLGTGGLLRAYSHAVLLALDNAQVLVMKLCNIYSIKTGYEMLTGLEKIVMQCGGRVVKVEYGEYAEAQIYIAKMQNESFLKQVITLSNARISPLLIGEIYYNL